MANRIEKKSTIKKPTSTFKKAPASVNAFVADPGRGAFVADPGRGAFVADPGRSAVRFNQSKIKK